MYLYLYVALPRFDTHNRAIDFTSQTLNLPQRETEEDGEKETGRER